MIALRRLSLLLVSITSAFPQSNPLPAHESLTYSIEWRLITAGRAVIDWSFPSSDSAQVKVKVESAGLVSKLFRVDDNYIANLGFGLCAQSVEFNAEEGSRRRETKINFDYPNRRIDYLERDLLKNTILLAKETEIPPCTHDIAGGLYFLRSLNIEPGQSALMPLTDGKKSAVVKVEAQQREEIKTPAGVFKTVRYEAYVFDNVLYRRPAHLYVWLTDDPRRLPVQIRVRMQVTIGSITLQLEKHE
ncbi:MAG TPA: DUF3108 domain-containing protein [Bryobacteraceae bacterium]|nr:DUF3108 domain-containing protein [Bryobacteraceae bacterium]